MRSMFFRVWLSAVCCVWASTAWAQPVAVVHAELARMTAVRDHLAVASGSWTDPQTWGGTVPCSGRLEIPAGVTVTVSTVVPCAYEYVVVGAQGTLSLEDGAQLTVGTVVAHGTYRQTGGTLTVKSNGLPFDHAADPLELMRGLIAMSPVHIEGAAKREWCALDGFPAAGATSVTLACDPEGWEVGDVMLVAPTLWGQDETVTVTAIDGRTVTFTPALKFSRQNAPADPRVKLHVGNMTRNVRVESHVDDAGNRHRQGHVMLMGGGHVVKHAAFRDTGRTVVRDYVKDKNLPVSDPILLPDGSRDPQLMPLCGLDEENVRGRYSLHFHNAGPSSAPSTVEGVVVRVPREKGFKIGIQNHSSYVLARRNIVHQIDGSGLFTEEGDERGEYVDNFVVHSRGNNVDNPEDTGSRNCWQSRYPEIWNRRRTGFGARGAGIWLQGNNVLLRGNVFAGHAHAAIDHTAAGLDRAHTNTFVVQMRPDHLRDGHAWMAHVSRFAAGYDPSSAILRIWEAPLRIEDTHSYANGPGIQRYGSKAAVFGEYQLAFDQGWAARPKNLIKGLVAWNANHCMDFQYSDFGALEDVVCIAGPLAPGQWHSSKSARNGIATRRQDGRFWDYRGVEISGYTTNPFQPSEGSRFADVTVDGQPYVPTIEACEDGIDNDNDGAVDEGCLVYPDPPDPPDTTPPTDASTPPVLSTGIYALTADASGEVAQASVTVKGESTPRCEGPTPLPCTVALTEWPAVIVVVLTDAAGNSAPPTEWTVER